MSSMREPGPENGDFERLMRESYRLVYQVAYSVLGNAADAEEVAQDRFLTAYRKFDSLRDAEKFRPWVARASWRLALNHRRGAARAMGRRMGGKPGGLRNSGDAGVGTGVRGPFEGAGGVVAGEIE